MLNNLILGRFEGEVATLNDINLVDDVSVEDVRTSDDEGWSPAKVQSPVEGGGVSYRFLA